LQKFKTIMQRKSEEEAERLKALKSDLTQAMPINTLTVQTQS